ncbi:hypothetical protein SK128_009397 [Halocaridina rubra]|uniref:C2H2-type domain-containing protein n=1 Tax=Halocaridina rubra TaxID=373956 RepID=A0AAN8XJR6_HALRR
MALPAPQQVEMENIRKWSASNGGESKLQRPWIHHGSGNTNSIHKCPYCHFTADTMNVLSRHISQHTVATKSYSCPHCSYSCSRRGNLETHIRIHTGEKPYSCQYCPYRSSRMFSLKSHMANHHPAER